MEDLTIPGWRAWPKALPEKTPLEFFSEPVLKPMIVDQVVVEVPDVPQKGEAKPAEAKTPNAPAEPDDVLVIKLKWSYVA